MNTKIVDFAICVNNEKYFEECLWFIKRLHIPDGYDVHVTPIREAENIADAYNNFMNRSDAKYKIYLHQDSFILNIHFIDNIISIFNSDEKVGMIGMLGGKNVPGNAICYNSWNLGGTYACNVLNTFKYWADIPYDEKVKYYEADAVDGMLIATGYDIPWRNDLNYGWDFYDVSQSMEFKKAGYKVVIPNQKELWCLHDCGISKLSKYDLSRKIIMQEYSDVFDGTFEEMGYEEIYQMSERLFEMELEAFQNGNIEQLIQIDTALYNQDAPKNNNLAYMHIFTMILLKEIETDCTNLSFIGNDYSFEKMLDMYTSIKFYIRRRIMDGKDYRTIAEDVKEKYYISDEAYEVIYNCVSF